MKHAYEVSGTILGTTISPRVRSRLGGFKDGEILVVPGTYDEAQDVLDTIGVRHDIGKPNRTALERAKILIVNCPGDLMSGYEDRVKGWVAGGGLMLTTDWAIEPLQRMFPNLIRWNGKCTEDECIRLDTRTLHNGSSSDTLDMDLMERPVWWLEGSSYPFNASAEVEVLLTSEELKKRYGSSLVAVQWDHGLGRVRHMISHLYLQRSESRSVDEDKVLSETLEGFGMDSSAVEQLAQTVDLGTISQGEVASSLSSTSELISFITNSDLAGSQRIAGQPVTRTVRGPGETTWIG